MKPCSTCQRPLLSVARSCPFCGNRLSAHWLKVAAGAVVAPFVLSACYGAPPCETADNDGDGAFACVDGSTDGFWNEDCDDTDPDINPAQEEVCDDGVDNNCDGISAGTEQAEVCGNELDDDCDGEVDELSDEPGVEADCFDGLDDDCDGLPDFEDPDCDDDSDADTDTDSDSEPPGIGSIALSVGFEGEGVTCATADVPTFQIAVDGPEPVSTFSVACTQEPIVLAQLQGGEWSVEVEGLSSDATQVWSAEPLTVFVNAEQTSGVQLSLGCTVAGTDTVCD